MIFETERLGFREMGQEDFGSLCKILQDDETMYAYEGAFCHEEVQEWLERQISRYKKWGFGLWAVILKESNEMIGQCGLTMQPWKGEEVLEIGYLFQRAYWHKGYATEAAKGCKEYAFHVLHADAVCSIIRDTNTASQKVALRNGMRPTDTWVKHYRGVDMPHICYRVERKETKKMEMEKVIARINELYHKSKKEGLSEEEKQEQSKLRGIYIATVRGNLKSQLDNISVVNPDGSITDLADVAAKNKKKAH